ncbi:SUKH superfamily protein [Novosphingobium sp. PhB165]|nr:SUKH superfamily protein [Novosphingobium sp. PhB165]
MFAELDADLNGDPVLVAGPALESQIDAIQAFAGFPLSPSYREFVKRFGAALVGPYPVYGSGASDAMSKDDASVIDVTKRFRSDGWPYSDRSLVVSTDHAGNAIMLDEKGSIHRYDHDAGTIEFISSSFESFVQWCLTK